MLSGVHHGSQVLKHAVFELLVFFLFCVFFFFILLSFTTPPSFIVSDPSYILEADVERISSLNGGSLVWNPVHQNWKERLVQNMACTTKIIACLWLDLQNIYFIQYSAMFSNVVNRHVQSDAKTSMGFPAVLLLSKLNAIECTPRQVLKSCLQAASLFWFAVSLLEGLW